MTLRPLRLCGELTYDLHRRAAENAELRRVETERLARLKKRLTLTQLYFMIRSNTGKEVILKFMSSYHSEVAAA